MKCALLKKRKKKKENTRCLDDYISFHPPVPEQPTQPMVLFACALLNLTLIPFAWDCNLFSGYTNLDRDE